MPELEKIRDFRSGHIHRIIIQHNPLIPGRCWTYLMEMLVEVFPFLTHFYIWRCPNRQPISDDEILFPVEAFVKFFQKALYLEVFILGKKASETGCIDLGGDELSFRDWGVALKNCNRLQEFHVSHSFIYESHPTGFKRLSNLRDCFQEPECAPFYSDHYPYVGGVSLWDPVVRTICARNEHSLEHLHISSSSGVSIAEPRCRLASETTTALLRCKKARLSPQAFPFVMHIAGDDIQQVVDYLLCVHKDGETETKFLPEDPSESNHAISGFTQEFFLKKHKFERPTFHMKYGDFEDFCEDQQDEILVILSADLVQPRLVERLLRQSPRRKMFLPDMTVVKECIATELSEPHLLLYQGLFSCSSLWQFDPHTASDSDWMNMLNVLGSLDSVDDGGDGTFDEEEYNASIIFGLNVRFDLLSAYQENLIRWLPKSSGDTCQTKAVVESKEHSSERRSGVGISLTNDAHTSNGRDDLELLHSLVATGGMNVKSISVNGILELFPRIKELVDNDIDFGRVFRRYWRNIKQESDCDHATIERDFYSYMSHI